MMFSPPTELNQRTRSAASADFFNAIAQKRPLSRDSRNGRFAPKAVVGRTAPAIVSLVVENLSGIRGESSFRPRPFDIDRGAWPSRKSPSEKRGGKGAPAPAAATTIIQTAFNENTAQRVSGIMRG
jgi:hypothetical protein